MSYLDMFMDSDTVFDVDSLIMENSVLREDNRRLTEFNEELIDKNNKLMDLLK